MTVTYMVKARIMYSTPKRKKTLRTTIDLCRLPKNVIKALGPQLPLFDRINRTYLYLWKKSKSMHDVVEMMMSISETSRAQSAAGMLSRKTSGRGP